MLRRGPGLRARADGWSRCRRSFFQRSILFRPRGKVQGSSLPGVPRDTGRDHDWGLWVRPSWVDGEHRCSLRRRGQARARGNACHRGFLADAVRAPPGRAVPGGPARSTNDGAARGPGAGLHFHRCIRNGVYPQGVLPRNLGPLGDSAPGSHGRQGFLQEDRVGAGEAEALRGQALPPGNARHYGRAHPDDDVPQALSGLLSSATLPGLP
ncbi:unnamed protein product [Pylaiella littoralis]